MKKFILLCGALFLFNVSQAAEYVENVNYIRIKDNASQASADQIEVVEVFGYSCPHCYDLEAALQRWRAKKGKDIRFVQVPGVFGASWMPFFGKFWNHARAYYAFEKMGVLDKIHRPFFEAIHEGGLKLDSKEDIAGFIAQQGFDKNAFTKYYDSEDIENKVEFAKKLKDRYAVEGTPAIVVDGTFMTTPGMLGDDHNALMAMVDYLVAKAKKERKADLQTSKK